MEVGVERRVLLEGRAREELLLLLLEVVLGG